ncbi:hypothetical protein [Enterococcus gallinarum]|uniref:hypothetical protein n=1 Tax=Enterococcus gallinarum TaxID=1353 RepID=UPI0015591DF3|nr:hypothetical protein [Enterococcus gallinarum]
MKEIRGSLSVLISTSSFSIEVNFGKGSKERVGCCLGVEKNKKEPVLTDSFV